jgi:hypothetical protein
MNSGPFTNSHTVRAPDTSEGATNHQESALNKLTKIQQIEVLKFAHNHQIRPDDPAWMLVEMLGHVRYTTDTLPARIEAAGNNAVETINQQRLIEQRAFSANAMRETTQMMDAISQKIAEKSDSITQEELHRRLLINSLTTISWLSVLIAGSVVCGYFIAKGGFYWAVEGEISFINIVSTLFNLPIGFVILPSFIGGMALMIWQLAVNIKRNDWR